MNCGIIIIRCNKMRNRIFLIIYIAIFALHRMVLLVDACQRRDSLTIIASKVSTQ